MKVGIIGAGPAGITAAYQLSKAGIDVDIYEAGSSVGGLAKTISLWDQHVDLGPHRFFSTDRRVNELWLEVVGKDYDMVDRLTRIYYNKDFFNYPLRVGNALKNLGPIEAAHCMLSYFQQKIAPIKQDGSFEDWVVNQFGRHLFEIFFKTYSEKLWGITCKELDSDFASQRIKKLSLTEAIKNAVFSGKGNKHKTLVDKFAYPHEGSGVVYNRMAQRIRENGHSVHLSMPVERVVQSGNKAVALELSDGTQIAYDHIISSMPLTLLVQRLDTTPQELLDHTAALKFRNTTLVYLHINDSDLFPDNWIYVHDPSLQFGRITNFRNWTPQLYKNETTSILALEYWSYDDDSIWQAPEQDLIELGKKEIRQTGLIGNAEILDGKAIKIRRCYPVYNKDYKTHLKPIEHYLSGIENLSVIGRYGAFKYNNQDHSILMGILAAEKIIDNADHNLWDINTNYDTYQETALITETGLSTS
ncbi:MAG: FAD-dependent oxidoreductase [Rhodothermales bacterium]